MVCAASRLSAGADGGTIDSLATAHLFKPVPTFEQADLLQKPLEEPIPTRSPKKGADLRFTVRNLSGYELPYQALAWRQVPVVGNLEIVLVLINVLRQLVKVAHFGV